VTKWQLAAGREGEAAQNPSSSLQAPLPAALPPLPLPQNLPALP